MTPASVPANPDAMSPQAALAAAEAARRQAAYAATRRAWAEQVGRPYEDETDFRPPPGEVDAGPEE